MTWVSWIRLHCTQAVLTWLHFSLQENLPFQKGAGRQKAFGWGPINPLACLVLRSQALEWVTGLGNIVRNTQRLNWTKMRSTQNTQTASRNDPPHSRELSILGNCESFLSFFFFNFVILHNGALWLMRKTLDLLIFNKFSWRRWKLETLSSVEAFKTIQKNPTSHPALNGGILHHPSNLSHMPCPIHPARSI